MVWWLLVGIVWLDLLLLLLLRSTRLPPSLRWWDASVPLQLPLDAAAAASEWWSSSIVGLFDWRYWLWLKLELLLLGQLFSRFSLCCLPR
jgi:hypothetical protein